MAMTIKTNDVLTKFKEVADKIKSGEIITVSRPKNENIIMISELEFQEYAKAKRNAEYIAKLDKAEEDYKAGRVKTFTFEELEQYTKERLGE